MKGRAAARFAGTGLTGCASSPATRVSILADVYPCREVVGDDREFGICG